MLDINFATTVLNLNQLAKGYIMEKPMIELLLETYAEGRSNSPEKFFYIDMTDEKARQLIKELELPNNVNSYNDLMFTEIIEIALKTQGHIVSFGNCILRKENLWRSTIKQAPVQNGFRKKSKKQSLKERKLKKETYLRLKKLVEVIKQELNNE